MLTGLRQLAPGEAELRRQAERELESAVQEGLSAVMSAAAKAIREYSPGQKPRYRADEGSSEEAFSSSSGDTSRPQRRSRS